jgi:hypothetical protein
MMPTVWTTVAGAAFTMVLMMAAVAFYIFIAVCLWRLVKACEQISLSLAQIAYKTKDEADA